MKDEIGNRYGRLVVVAFDHIDAKHNARFLCKCDCGCTTIVKGNALRSGKTKSCGCLKREYKPSEENRAKSSARMEEFNKTFWTDERREHNRELATIHGGTGTRLHRVWSHMKERCENEHGDHAKWYRDKGIRVCDEWQDFAVFREWALANGYKDPEIDADYKEYPSIDRIDPNKGYSPDNCRWVTVSENSRLRNRYYANQR